jgi:hypothetical protein
LLYKSKHMKQYIVNIDLGNDYESFTIQANNIIEAKRIANFQKRMLRLKGRTSVHLLKSSK